MRNTGILILLLGMLTACSTGQPSADDTERYISDLLQRMTLAEKIGQMNQLSGRGDARSFEELVEQVRQGRIGSLLNVTDTAQVRRLQEVAVSESRLGIPLLFARDVIHGYRTIFPIPLGQAATFHPQAVQEAARIAAIEATADGIRWTFAPMIDVARDARWGRIAESGGGEDPYLNAVMGEAMLRGFQGDSLSDPTSMAACAKHYAGYGATESGRDYNTTSISERQYRNVYLPPFQAAIQAGCATLMTAFNANDGIPCTANRWLLDEVLRREWGFDGVVVTDWCSMAEMMPHGYSADRAEAGRQALEAGVDMDMMSRIYIRELKSLVQKGLVTEQTIDQAVANILRLKLRLGLFEHPYIAARTSPAYAPEHLAKAKEVAAESAILLKNERQLLPLGPAVRRIAVVGPMADAPYDQLGTWAMDGQREATVTPLAALRQQYGQQVEILYERALAYSRDLSTEGIGRAVAISRQADVILAFVGEEAILSGEAHSLADIRLQGAQSQLLEAVSRTGRPLVTVVMAGRPLTIEREAALSDALLYSFHPGTMGGPALADILFGRLSPSGRTPVSFPRMVGQLPLYYAHEHTGRAPSGRETLLQDLPIGAPQTSNGCTSYYLDAGFGPLYPFGYGLTYTSFEYADLQLSDTLFQATDTLRATIRLTNSGTRRGTEVVQLYVRDHIGSVVRPVKELKRFSRVTLEAGESREVTFTLPISDLAFWGADGRYRVEPGLFTLWIAPDCERGLSASFQCF